MSAALALAAVALAAVSGVPGLALPRRRQLAADRAAAALLGLAVLCAAAAAGRVAGGAPGPTLALPWQLVGEPLLVGLDGLSAFFLLPVMGLAFAGSLYACAYWGGPEHARSARRLRLSYGLLAAGMGAVVVARHAFVFLAGWEVMALAAFFSITAQDERADVRRAGFLYLACTRASTLALFGCFALWHAASGRFDFEPAVALAPGASAPIFAAALLGFALKAGAMPLHVWLPDAHASAPSHVSALLSGMLIKMGIYGILRVCALLPPLPAWCGLLLLALGTASAVLGVAFALGQHQLKRLLAYHSIENIGIILMGVGLALLGRALRHPELEQLGLGGALLHVWNHALFKGLLFLGAGSVIHATGSGALDTQGGLARRMPHTALCFAIGAVAICGLPPLNGFVSELLVYLGLLRALTQGGGGSVPLLAVLAVAALALVGGLAAACFVKAFGVVFLGEPRSSAPLEAREAPLPMRAAMLLLTLGCVALGAAPQLALAPLAAAAASFDAELGAPGTMTLAALAPFAAVSLAALGLAALFGLGALALRGALRRPEPALARGLTWDCGWPAPSARMQYTASSFASGLTDLFRWALWNQVAAPRIRGAFPGPAELHTQLLDPVLDRVLLPAARGLARAAGWLRWLQQGHVHTYVLYILAALLAVLVAASGGLR